MEPVAEKAVLPALASLNGIPEVDNWDVACIRDLIDNRQAGPVMQLLRYIISCATSVRKL
jgi:hypothetical protein